MSAHWLALGFALVAALFACVGQAGGAGYLAVMGLSGLDIATTKATSLALNVVVAAIASVRFARLGNLRRADWLPFTLAAVPLSVLGGMINLPGQTYRLVVAALMLLTAIQMAWAALRRRDGAMHIQPAPPMLPSLLAGAAIGIVSGIVGIGGGIFLAPLLLLMHWADVRRTVAATAVFNLVVSLAGLAGLMIAGSTLPAAMPQWALAVTVGGVAGAWLGGKHLPDTALRLVLAVILLGSAIRLTLG